MPLAPACSERRLEKVTQYFLGIKGKIWVNCLQADIDEVPLAPLNRDYVQCPRPFTGAGCDLLKQSPGTRFSDTAHDGHCLVADERSRIVQDPDSPQRRLWIVV